MKSVNFSQLRADITILWIVVTTAFCGGFLINKFREHPLPLIYQTKKDRLEAVVHRLADAPVDGLKTALQLPAVISLEEFTVFVEEKRGLVLDARPEIFHRMGHVPGALSLPRDDFENAYIALKPMLEMDRGQPIVIYCSNASCEDGGLVRKSLVALGFTKIALFEGGWNEWSQAGKPEESK